MTAPSQRPPDPSSPTRHSRGEVYEEFLSRVYLTAVRLGVPSRAQLLDAGLADEDVDDAVAELMERGMLSPAEEGDRWLVVPPREALTRRMDQIERRVAMTRATASEVESMWRRAMGDVEQGAGQADLDVISGTVEIAHRIAGLHRSATSRLWWAVDDSAAAGTLFAEGAGGRWTTVRDGVAVRLVLNSSLLGDPDALAYADRARELGHEVRVANGVPFSVLMTDDTDVLVDLSRHAPDGDGSFEAHRTSWVQALTRLFVEIWDLSTPYGTVLNAGLVGEGARSAGRGRLPLEEKDARVLALLATGASDKVIARQLGVSVRTVERRVRYLMEHLGTGTRFQAGVQAVRRGWV
ncbi:LuxR C-terminal-related transcriptional regulator [Ornithinimicrobium sp. W1665]|uniref:LuxR C-terminal-related transcriptional regulator n=1 Tax=Ornithinimicrobium sp. W1665 TaxID=3416666 RepID=UPI003CE9EBAE